MKVDLGNSNRGQQQRTGKGLTVAMYTYNISRNVKQIINIYWPWLASMSRTNTAHGMMS